MKKFDVSKGLMISGIIYSVTLLFETFMQFSGLVSLQINSFAITSYLLVLVIRPISLMAIIIFACKGLSIILRACFILIDKNSNTQKGEIK